MNTLSFKQFFQNLSSGLGSEIVTSGIILILMTIFLAAINTFIKRQDWLAEIKRTRIVLLRNWIFILTLLLVVFTWRGEIKTFIISISAVAVGIMVAFKEIIFSFAAGFVINSTRLLSIGDFVEIDGAKGRVIDKNLLMVSLMLEEGGQSGRVMTISNMLLFNSKIINFSRYGSYGMYNLEINLKLTDNPILSSDRFLLAIDKITQQYSEEAQSEAEHIRHAEMLPLLSWKSSVNIDMSDINNNKMVARYCSPLGMDTEVAQKIVRLYLAD